MTEEIIKYRTLSKCWRSLLLLFSSAGILLAITQVFNFKPFGLTVISNAYLYVLLALWLSFVFIVYPATKTSPRDKVPFYDILLFGISIVCFSFFAFYSNEIITKGWELSAPPLVIALSLILCAVIMEAVRRAGGLPLLIICGVFALFPVFTFYLPGILRGTDFSFLTTAGYHIMSSESILGIPSMTFGYLIIGFIIFGYALQITGGGKFFLDIASCIFGWSRGGQAKVAITASALFGSMSGSAISNVLTIGTITIPMMKKAGFPSNYAAGVEACSSTGGVLMPPVMGATAFVMASFLGIPYVEIAIAAAIPSILYYLGLFCQVDGYAAKNNLAGTPRSELPSFKETLKEGWIYILTFIVLIYFLLINKEAEAPFYATAFVLAAAMIQKRTRINISQFLNFIETSGLFLAELLAILAGIGFIVGSLSVTGVASAFSGELVSLAHGNIYLLLILGALASFVLGMGMTVTACYIFLAIVMAPALIQAGLHPLAVHLYIMYWGMLSYITPPVALAAYVASGIAKTSPMATGFTAMRLGAIIYFLPFFFVLDPTLILQGTLLKVTVVFISAIAGTVVLAGALEGYLVGVGKLSIIQRAFLFIGGLCLIFPGTKSTLMGFIIIVLTILFCLYQKRTKIRKQTV